MYVEPVAFMRSVGEVLDNVEFAKLIDPGLVGIKCGCLLCTGTPCDDPPYLRSQRHRHLSSHGVGMASLLLVDSSPAKLLVGLS